MANDPGRGKPASAFSLHGVRYQATDIARAIAFYTGHLGFKLELQYLPVFGSVSLVSFVLLLRLQAEVALQSRRL